MKKEIADKWIAALESGEYKQGQNVLRSDDGFYCCLGVLCELAVKEGVIKPWDEGSGSYEGNNSGSMKRCASGLVCNLVKVNFQPLRLDVSRRYLVL